MTLGLLPIAFISTAFVIAWLKPVPKISVRLDLSHNLALSEAFNLEQCAASTLVKGQYDCISEGDVDLSLILRDDFKFSEPARLVWASGTKDKIERLLFFTQPLSLTDVQSLSEKLIASFQAPRERYDSWLREVNSGARPELKYLSSVDEAPSPTIEFSILPIQEPDNKDRSWFINGTFRWK